MHPEGPLLTPGQNRKPPRGTEATPVPVSKNVQRHRLALVDAAAEDAMGARCPCCRHVTTIPKLQDTWRSTRAVVFCSLPQMGIALWLLLRHLNLGSAESSGSVALVMHIGTLVAHCLLMGAVIARWVEYMRRSSAQASQVEAITTTFDHSDDRTLRIRWPGLEEYFCDVWLLVMRDLEKEDNVRVEVLPGSSDAASWGQRTTVSSALALSNVRPGHFWISLMPYHRNSGLGMPVAMGHCSVPDEQEIVAETAAHYKTAESGAVGTESWHSLATVSLPPGFMGKWRGQLPDMVDSCTDPKPWELVDAGTDPLEVVKPTADAEVQNGIVGMDAGCQFPAAPKEVCDSSTTPELDSASESLQSKMGTDLGSFDLPVTLRAKDQPDGLADPEMIPEIARGLWLSWDPHGLVEAAPRLVAHARHLGTSGIGDTSARVAADMSFGQASFQHLQPGKYELVLSCELGACSAEVVRCPQPRCAETFWSSCLEEHMKHCSYLAHPCPRAPDGCEWKGCPDELEDHLLVCCARQIRCRACNFGCPWFGAAQDEQNHYASCEVQATIETADLVERILAEPCPDMTSPELVNGIAHLKSFSPYVQLARFSQWREWTYRGHCYVCQKAVDRKTKGLQCQDGDHHICWSCMSKQIDWAKMQEEERELESINRASVGSRPSSQQRFSRGVYSRGSSSR